MTALAITSLVIAGIFVIGLAVYLILKAVEAAKKADREARTIILEPGKIARDEFITFNMNNGRLLEYELDADGPVQWGLVLTEKITGLKHKWDNKQYQIKSTLNKYHFGIVQVPNDGIWSFVITGGNKTKNGPVKVYRKIRWSNSGVTY